MISIAYRCVVVEHRHFEDKHIELAGRKAQRWDNIGAFNEYYSLIKSFPWKETFTAARRTIWLQPGNTGGL